MFEHFASLWPKFLTESETIQPFKRQFPYDVFMDIVSYLPRPALKCVSLVSHSYHDRVRSILWRSIRINPSTTRQHLLECYNAINNTPERALQVHKAVLTHFITSPDMPGNTEPGVHELIYTLLSSLHHLTHLVIDHAVYGGTFLAYRPFFEILNHVPLLPAPTTLSETESASRFLPFEIKVLELYEAVNLEGLYASPAGRTIERLYIEEVATYITTTPSPMDAGDKARPFPRLRILCAPPSVVRGILEGARLELIEEIVYVGRVNKDDADVISVGELVQRKDGRRPVQIRWEREERENGTWEYDTYARM